MPYVLNSTDRRMSGRCPLTKCHMKCPHAPILCYYINRRLHYQYKRLIVISHTDNLPYQHPRSCSPLLNSRAMVVSYGYEATEERLQPPQAVEWTYALSRGSTPAKTKLLAEKCRWKKSFLERSVRRIPSLWAACSWHSVY